MGQSKITGEQPPRWEPPVQQEAPPLKQRRTSAQKQNGSTAGRAWFWAAAGFSWTVLALSMTAAAHDEWVIGKTPAGTGGLEAGNAGLLRACNELDDIADDHVLGTLCDYYRGFTATQFAATAACSVAVGLLTVAAFRPAVVGCAPVKHLGIASGSLMILYFMCQVVAVILAFMVKEEYDYVFNEVIGGESSAAYDFEFKLGLTCWLGIVGLVLALFTSVCLFVTVKHAGDGPFVCNCCKKERSVEGAHVVCA